MNNLKNLYLPPSTYPVRAVLNLPGSKSIANRVLLLAALADGESIIHNVPCVAEDVVLMLQSLQQLGVRIERIDNNANNAEGSASYKIIGCCGEFPVREATIFCGGSGTLTRFLTAVLAFMPHANYQITGIKRLLERPISDLVDALLQCGADITYSQNDGFLPLKIGGYPQRNIVNDKSIQNNSSKYKDRIMVNGNISSQFLSGLLIGVGGVLNEMQEIVVVDELMSKPYIDMTVALLIMFGVDIITGVDSNNKLKYIIHNGHQNHRNYQNKISHKCRYLKSCTYTIEPDASSASYFLAMGSINHGDITINHLSGKSLQGDKNFAQVLAKMGALSDYLPDSIRVRGRKLKAIEVDMQDMPDVAMTLAVLALFATGTTIIHGISTWRVKETDRAYAMYTELTKLGATVVLDFNTITITPPKQILSNISIDTYNDHRIAMCFSLVALANVPIIIDDYECVNKTFANYFDVYSAISKFPIC
jgi:3-phosphoshikimate 1-carboxyvinyltransferase